MKELPLEQRLSDLLKLSEKRGSPVFTAFLNEREQFLAGKFLDGKRADHLFWGGHEECTRKILCVSPDGAVSFPIYPLTVSFRKTDTLSHRDFLGSFLSLGIERDQLGDILISEGSAVVFCTKTAHDLITSSVSKVGRVGVSVKEGILAEIPKIRFEEISVTVSSVRADCVVSAVLGFSRNKSSEYIHSGAFLLNYEECKSADRTVNVGDILTMRGYGKYVMSGEAEETRKGRFRIRLEKYS